MKKRRIIRWVLVLFCVPIAAWFIIGAFVGHKVSQRAETRHAKFQQDCEPQSLTAWREADTRRAWLTWKHRTPESLEYEIRLYADRTFLTTVRYKSGTVQPDRFEQVKASAAAWAGLEEALRDPEILGYQEKRGTFDSKVVIAFDQPGQSRKSVSFLSENFGNVPLAVSKLDERIAEIVADASLKPPRRYAHVSAPVTYEAAEVGNLVRGLESDHSEAYPHVIRHLAAIGEPSLPELERVLAESSPRDLGSQTRIKAVLDGLTAFPECHERVLPKVREIAAVTHANKRRGPLVPRAADFVEEVVTRKYQQEAFARRGFAFTPPSGPPSTELRRKYNEVLAVRRKLSKPDRVALTRELAAMGPEIFGLVLETLREDGPRISALIDTLGVIGGPDAILLAFQMEAFEAQDCVKPLVKLGDAGIPALLFLLEFGEAYPRSLISSAFHKDHSYRSALPHIHEMLERQRRRYREATEEDLRLLHRDGIQKLIGILMAFDAQEAQTVQCLLETAIDTQQHDSIRSNALKLLRRIGAPATQVVEALKKQSGYETGSMYADFSKTVKALGGKPE